jgi:Short C-terminal domain
MIGSASSHSKNRKNVEVLIRATTNVLERSGAKWTAELGITRSRAPTLAPQSLAPASSQSRLEQLKTLGELRDSGVLTPEEFETEKAQIMGMDRHVFDAAQPTIRPVDAGTYFNALQKDLSLDLAQPTPEPTSSLSAAPDVEIGWHQVGDDERLRRYWNGHEWNAYMRWDGTAWVEALPEVTNDAQRIAASPIGRASSKDRKKERKALRNNELSELEKRHQSGDLSDEEYHTERARIFYG